MVNEDYLACSAYEGQSMHESEGNFSSFYNAESQQHFFALLDADGKVLLKSEGYPQPAARENGIQSVIKNRTNRDFYSVKEEDGTYYLSLRAANYREIARSCNVGSESEAMALIAYATGEQVRGGVQATAVAPAKERADDRIDDDYMACKSYEGYGGPGNAIVGFQHEGGQHYFGWYGENGDVLMRSEGYPTTAARDNGMASVEKNKDMEERYAILEKMGRFFVILKAGNHQEIARSCPFNSEAEARAIFPSGRAAIAQTKIDSAAAEAAAVIAAAATASLAATTPETVVETVTETVVSTTAPVEAVAEAVVDVEDDYLPCRDYHGHTTTPRDGFRTFFSDKSNKYYFAIVDEDGDVTLRSEGHLTAADRDEDMADVVRNMFKKERYNIKKVGFHHHFIVLRNEHGKEIARSCAHDSMESVHTVAPFLNPEKPAVKVAVAPIAMAATVSVAAEPAASVVETLKATETINEAPLATVVGTVAATVAATSMAAATPVIVETVETVPVVPPPAPVVEAPAAPTPPADVEDDYLPCKEYEGRPISDKANSVTMFKHSNGQFYFAIYNADGGVRLRSEGFRTSQDRDKELSGALKNLNNADMYTTVRRGDYYMSILKDKTGREVGRSCLQKDEPIAVVAPPVIEAPIVEPLVALAAVGAVGAAISEVTVPEVEIPEVKVAAPAYVAPEIVEEVAAETGFKWWWLLLPLLALLGWWLFGKGCNTAVPPAPVTPVETPKAAEPAAPVPAAAPSCDLNWILFDFDKSDITAAANAELAQMAKILKENKDYVGVLSAHTDGRGSDTYNDALSLRRASAAKKALAAMGIEADRLKTKADGKGAPVAQNTQDDAGRQFNRRVELYIQDKNGKDICQSIAPNIPDALKTNGK
jgi:outer membrane protein OmpA-like peptidoglycan-associated protein/uncharacterized protein YegP (UPF0339 family)